jgi:hypothetical protein
MLSHKILRGIQLFKTRKGQIMDKIKEIREFARTMNTELGRNRYKAKNLKTDFCRAIRYIDYFLKKTEMPKNNRKLSESIVPHLALGVDCCGCFYWSDDGAILCNECGFDLLSRLDQVTEERDGLREGLETMVPPVNIIYTSKETKDNVVFEQMSTYLNKYSQENVFTVVMSWESAELIATQALKGQCKTCGGSGEVKIDEGEGFETYEPCPRCKEDSK